MSNSNKPVIFLTHFFGWTTRNLFQTGIVDRLLEYFEVVVLGSRQAKETLERSGYSRKLTFILIEPGEEPWLWKMLRQAKKKFYTESRQSVTQATFERYRKSPVYQRLGSILFKAITRVIPAIRLYQWVEGLDYSLNRDRSLRELFEKYKPSFVFFSHATHYRDELVLRNARAMGVPKLFMILSWDHVATAKILLGNHFDRILVWNNHSREEIIATYPHISPATVQVVGIPQFDIYAQSPSTDYTGFCAKFGLDPKKKTILFSTMPQLRHEQQHIILEELLKWIAAEEQSALNFQILIKTHPFDNFKGYRALLTKYPVALRETTLPLGVDSMDWVPAPEEIEISRDCLYFCAININIFSTVTIEAAYFDKPVIHIAFDPLPVQNRVPTREYYNWDHFKHIVDMDASILVECYEDLFNAIRAYSSNPELKRQQRKMLILRYIGRPVGFAVEAVVNNVREFHGDLAVAAGRNSSGQ